MVAKVLVLAGSRTGIDLLAQSEKVGHKALIELDGKTMLARVLGQLRESGLNDILVASNSPEVLTAAQEMGAKPIAAEHSPSTTVLSVLEEVGAPLIVTTSDHGLLQSEWIRHLVDGTGDGSDMGLMLARRDLIEAEWPQSKRTYLRFSDGDWSGCNLFYLKTNTARAAIKLWQTVEKDRKRPWRIAARIGLGTLFSMLLGRLDASTAVWRLGAKVGANVTMVPAPSGLAAIDADTPLDLAHMREIVARQRVLEPTA